MAIAFTTGSETVTTTEHSIFTDTAGPDSETTDKIVQAVIHFNAVADGDVFAVRMYESDGTTQRRIDQWVIAHAQTNPAFVLPQFMLGVGYDITLVKLAGTDRAITWSIGAVT